MLEVEGAKDAGLDPSVRLRPALEARLVALPKVGLWEVLSPNWAAEQQCPTDTNCESGKR